MLIELTLWATVGILLNAVGYQINTWQFWCFISTYWAVSTLGRQRGRIEGMIDFLEMSDEDQTRLKQVLQQVKDEVK
jgi:hypothetical protein